MILKKNLTKYYLLCFLPLALILIGMIKFKVFWFDQVIFVLSYIWQLTINTPGLEEKVFNPNYKFSFLRLIFLMNRFFHKAIEENPHSRWQIAVRIFSPLLFCSTIVILNGMGNILYVIAGVVGSELILSLWNLYFSPN